MGYGSEEKKEQTVEISMDGFVDTLEALRDENEFRFGDEDSTNAAWDLFIEMVKGDYLNLFGGPKAVLDDFQYHADVVTAEDKDIDNMIQELNYMRGNIIESALRLRHAYRPAEFRSEVMRLHQLSENWKENQKSCKKEVSGLMAKILGFEKMPEEAIDFRLYNDTSHDSVVVNFSIKGKPMSVAVSLPVEVDYRRRHSIPDDNDKYVRFYTDSLVEKTPQIVLYVFLGAVAESGEFGVDTTDCIHAVCPDMKTLSEKVKLAIWVDVRDKMKKVMSITEVKTVDDFCYGRGLRAANASASLHSSDWDRLDG